MQNPILYYIDWSPPSRAVLLLAKIIGIELDIKVISLLDADHLKPEFIKINPQHTIPLLDDNGAIIVDSHAICAYLCDKYAKTDSLYPKDLVRRAKVEARMHFDTSYLFTRFRFMFEPILYAGGYEVSDEKVAFMQKAWAILEAFLEQGEYICGDDLTIADLCCVATIRSMDKYVPIDPTKYTKTLSWLAKIADLPEYRLVNGVGGPEFQAVIDRKIIENRLLANVK